MPIWLDDVMCLGSEASLMDCPRPPFGIEDCDHIQDAGVDCSPTVPPTPPITTASPEQTTSGPSENVTTMALPTVEVSTLTVPVTTPVPGTYLIWDAQRALKQYVILSDTLLCLVELSSFMAH